jgi:hypothetical protein
MDDHSNYRGISLINDKYMILSNITYYRLYKLAENFDKIDESHAGFRACYFTIDNLYNIFIKKYGAEIY